MQHLKLSGESEDEAVSPVVGVMLMVVVVIIIAAVVSGFAGGLVGDTSQKAPTLTMDVKVINMGSWTGSGFFATVTSVSKPIPTSDLKIVTSWMAADGTSGGSLVLPKIVNTKYVLTVYPLTPPITGTNSGWISPWGGGPGLDGSITRGGGGSGSLADTNPWKFTKVDQQFGYYELVPGTTLMARPCGVTGTTSSSPHIEGTTGASDGTIGYGISTPYTYTEGTSTFTYTYPAGSSYTPDAMRAMLGSGWEKLREGDTVNIKVIHIPSGKVIFNKDVPVTEG